MGQALLIGQAIAVKETRIKLKHIASAEARWVCSESEFGLFCCNVWELYGDFESKRSTGVQAWSAETSSESEFGLL